ncbi:hypothetical protein AW736_11305 [Termitidicoccus mucosus]|uniref:Right handed beta helix domain-containing protein n=1 Tax=Termitidicoccus mucosus TaxID=1184151 RepID=A0A178IKS3_9BACT|nr:hypothetical protein AW736_11305 [Opitutaceae bacterium TSB47]
MSKGLAFAILVAVSLASISVIAKPISDVLHAENQAFDPWNKERWADWYEDGQIVKPFIIDRSVTFAPRTEPWTFSLEKFKAVNGVSSAVFVIQGGRPVVIDGNNVVLDARKPEYRDWSARDWHEKPFKRDEINTRVYGFRFQQSGNSDLPSILRNITLMGFWRAVETRHRQQQLPVIWENITARRNTCAFYTTGGNGIIRNCRVFESISMGIYADQASHNWTIENNTFRDNAVAGTRSWSDITLDACYAYAIRNNDFLPPSGSPKDYFSAITFYRNQGERGDIREYAASWHRIERNRFQGFNVAVDVGVRTGMKPTRVLTNLAQEGRSYASYNFIQDNSFKNCRIGILLRTGFNKIGGNIFENTEVPIALHNVFYSLHQNIIINQPNERVAIWSEVGEFKRYAKYVAFHDGLGAQIGASQKFYHVISPTGAPSFTDPGKATLVVSDALVDLPAKGGNPANYNAFSLSPRQAQATGFDNKPVDMAVGKFTESLPAGDFAVIFDRPSSRIVNKNYYSIYLFDQNGREFDRCGRSEKRWSTISAGNFLPDSGEHVQNGNDEIAAVSSEPDENGSYPVYIFRKGIAKPAVVLMKDNKSPVTGLAAGNFHTGGDEYDEIAVLCENAGAIRLVKPTDPSWRSEIQMGNAEAIAIVAGEFDGDTRNGDEIAAIVKGTAPISLFKVGGNNPYAFSGFAEKWERIAVGAFRGGDTGRDQLAAVRSKEDGFIIHFFDPEKTDAFQTMVSPLPGKALRIAGGQYVMPDRDGTGGPQFGGLIPPAIHRPVVSQLAVLPITSRDSIPVLVWMRVQAESKAGNPLQIVPLLK